MYIIAILCLFDVDKRGSLSIREKREKINKDTPIEECLIKIEKIFSVCLGF